MFYPFNLEESLNMMAIDCFQEMVMVNSYCSYYSKLIYSKIISVKTKLKAKAWGSEYHLNSLFKLNPNLVTNPCG